MKKSIGVYSICWSLLLIMYNVIVFVTPSEMNGISKFSDGFWIGYGFSLAAFVSLLVVSIVIITKNNAKRIFLGLPMLKTSYICLVMTMVFSTIFMAIPVIPAWISAIVNVIIMAVGVVSVLVVKEAGEYIEAIDNKTEQACAFVKTLIAQASSLDAYAQTDVAKDACKTVYEALRYTDPMSSPQLAEVEEKMQKQFELFSNAVKEQDDNAIGETSNRMVQLTKERAAMCKSSK